MRYKLGIIGVGTIAKNRILPLLPDSEDFELTCIYDADPSRLKNVANNFSTCKVAASPEEFFKSPCDAVYIATPNCYHVPYAIQALERGMAVLVEKPCAATVEAAEALTQAAKKSARPAMVAYMAKWNRYNQAALQLVREGRIGEIRTITASFGCFYVEMEAWRMRRSESGPGALADLGIYPVTTALDIFDEMPVSCSAQAFPAGDPVCGDLFLNGRVDFSRGRWLQITTSFVSSTCGYTITGTEGLIHVGSSWGQDGKGEIVVCTKQGTETIVREEVNPYAEELRCLKACLDGQPMPKGLSMERGAQDVKVIDALDRSAANMGGNVKITQ